MPRTTPYYGICARCGKPFESYEYRSNRIPKYCSRSCGQPNRFARQIVSCSVCKIEFERKRYHVLMSGKRGLFCGFDCYAQWQSENLTGEANPTYDSDVHQILECDWCGTEFERAKYVRGGKHHFCSRPCFQEYAKKNYRHHLPTNYGKSWIPAKKRALKRDYHQCQECGVTSDLIVHHIQPYKTFEKFSDAHKLNNLITLCRTCHHHIHNQSAF